MPSSANVIGVGPDSLPETEAISLEAGCSINHVQLSWTLPISVYLLLHPLVLVGGVLVPWHTHVGVVDNKAELVELLLM